MIETLEEAAANIYPVNNTGSMFMASRDELNNILKQESFVEGAKWMQERMYSKEDMKKCWDACERFDRLISEGDAPNFNEFIEKFKKK